MSLWGMVYMMIDPQKNTFLQHMFDMLVDQQGRMYQRYTVLAVYSMLDIYNLRDI
jgi:hypothetical protein